MADDIQCALGIFQNYAKQHGAVADETELNKEINDPHSQSVYANGSLKYNKSIGNPIPDPLWQKGMEFMSGRKDLVMDVLHYIKRADSVLGKSITDQVEKIYQDHLADVKSKGLEIDKAKYLWEENAVPKISKLYYDSFKEMSKSEPNKMQYLNDYFDNHIKGGRLYAGSGKQTIIGRLTKNLLNNFISWNPALVAYHALEATPKLMAYAVEHGGTPADVITAIAEHLKANGGNPFGQASDMVEKGLYGLHDEGQGYFKSNVHRLVDLSENPLRGVAYRLGEKLGTGGTHAVENIAFVYRYGNEPMLAMTPAGLNDFGMMRYTLGQSQFLLHLTTQAAKGDMKALGALAAFSAVNAMQTGFKSLVPAPLNAVLPQDIKDSIQALDDAVPGANFVKKFTGSDFSDRTAPLSFPSVGVPLAMVNEATKSSGRAFKQASDEAQQGNLPGVAAKIVQGLWGIGQLDSIKGVNILTNRGVSAVADQLTGNTDNADFVQGAGEDFLKKVHLKQEAK